MIRVFYEGGPFKWIDILSPDATELQAVAEEYGIHPAFVIDALQPEHLPKFEPLGNTDFFILRYYAIQNNEEADTIQELTNKVAIFHAEGLIITIHRFEVAFIDDVKRQIIDTNLCKNTLHLLNRLTRAVLFTYEEPAHALTEAIDKYESKTFLKSKLPAILKGLYHVRRKVEVSKRLLILSKDILDKVDDPRQQDPDTRDTRDLYIRLLTLFDFMDQNVNHLLNIYFSLSTQRTNEVIRVLTLFSVFFMPLTFIVGIYGMNFKFMPELEWRFGYPAILLFMTATSIAIFVWFRRKGWL
jgi:magnesium transporter